VNRKLDAIFSPETIAVIDVSTQKDNVSFISQSGVLCTAVLDFVADKGFGFSKFISIGNKADVDELDLFRYYHANSDTDVVIIYTEEISRSAEEFIMTIREMTSGPNPTRLLQLNPGRPMRVRQPTYLIREHQLVRILCTMPYSPNPEFSGALP
jgi:hypothetical protein